MISKKEIVGEWRKVVVVLDGLDQLTRENNAQLLTWFKYAVAELIPCFDPRLPTTFCEVWDSVASQCTYHLLGDSRRSTTLLQTNSDAPRTSNFF